MKKESDMYPICSKYLEDKDYRILRKNRKVRLYASKDTKDMIGQRFIEFDVVGIKDQNLWLIECKSTLTVEFFSFGVGQLMAYKFLLENTPLKKDFENKHDAKFREAKYSLALLQTEKHKLKNQAKTFRGIIRSYDLPFNILIIDEANSTIQEI